MLAPMSWTRAGEKKDLSGSAMVSPDPYHARAFSGTLLVFASDHWIAGVRHTFTHSFLPEPATATETHRLGPLLGYRFFDTSYSMFNQPTVNLLGQWWLVHPYRTGARQPLALPLIALAFSFNGDFL